MKKLYYQINGIFQFMVEFLAQIAYIGYIISAILILFYTLPQSQAIIYSVSLLSHLATIAFWGYISLEDLGNSTTSWKSFSFTILNICIITATIIITHSLIAVPLYLVLGLLGLISVYCVDNLICVTASKKRPKLEILFEKHPSFWYMIFLMFPILTILILLIIIPWNLIIELCIIILYIISMPFIAMAADNGFDIQEIVFIFSETFYKIKQSFKTRDT